jgi:signal transduction histidine kinase
LGVVILLEDITEAKLLQKAKDDFFSIASHELRTPLTTIRGNTSLIMQYFADEIKSPDLKEMIGDIHTSAVRLIGLVNDFLNTSRLEQGRMQFKKEAFDITSTVIACQKELNQMALERKLYLRVEVSLGQRLPPAFADPDKVKEIILNLMSNALKFTDTGGVSVQIRQLGPMLKVSVIDTGRGIPESSKSMLFGKFQQASNNPLIRDPKRSTGLGLYISRLMVKGMGGEIGLESTEEGKGSIFSFTIPAVSLQNTGKNLNLAATGLTL